MSIKSQLTKAKLLAKAQLQEQKLTKKIQSKARELTDDQKLEILEMKKILTDHVKKTGQNVYVATDFGTILKEDVPRLSFEDFAKWIVKYKTVIFFDVEYNPIDPRRIKYIEVKKEVKTAESSKDKDLSKAKLEKLCGKILHTFKDKNPLIKEGAEEFLNKLLKEI